MTNPKTYTSDVAVFVDGNLVKAGVPFTTSAPKGKSWESVNKSEQAAIEASQPGAPSDISLETLDLSALRALAATKKVDSDGLSKKALITAIKAADEPRL